MRDKQHIVSMILAGILHVAIVAAMLFVFEWSDPAYPATPLAIQGTLVSQDELLEMTRVVEEPEAEPEPEPDPDPEPDNSEQLRIEAEERKLQEDLERERDRIAREDVAEQRRKQAEAEERKRREEAETVRRRNEAERKRQEDIERQRVENERLRKLAQEEERRRQFELEMQAEQNRIDRENANVLARYQFALRQAIVRNWVAPASAEKGLSCDLLVRQSSGGVVLSVVIRRCNGDEAVRRSIEVAVKRASPLPLPDDPKLLDLDLLFRFEPTD